MLIRFSNLLVRDPFLSSLDAELSATLSKLATDWLRGMDCGGDEISLRLRPSERQLLSDDDLGRGSRCGEKATGDAVVDCGEVTSFEGEGWMAGEGWTACWVSIVIGLGCKSSGGVSLSCCGVLGPGVRTIRAVTVTDSVLVSAPLLYTA